MIVAMLMAVVMIVVVIMIVAARLRVVTIISSSDETDAKDTGEDRSDEADDGSNDRRYPSEEGVRDQDGIRARFRSGDQESHARGTGGSLPPHLGDHGHDRTTAQRHRHAHGRADADRLQTVVTKPPENRPSRDKDVNQARKEQPEQQHGRQQQQG